MHISRASNHGECFKAPLFTGLKAYMVPVILGEPLPESLSSYQVLVDNMAVRGKWEGYDAFLMIDEDFVKAGEHHRRPGIHVEGNWMIAGHHPRPPTHTPPNGPSHRAPRHSFSGEQERVIMWSTTGGTAYYKGNYSRDFMSDWRGGDCSDVDISSMDRITSRPYEIWETDVLGLHETTPMPRSTNRSFVRINIPLH
jgi:hypothetical protein